MNGETPQKFALHHQQQNNEVVNSSQNKKSQQRRRRGGRRGKSKTHKTGSSDGCMQPSSIKGPDANKSEEIKELGDKCSNLSRDIISLKFHLHLIASDMKAGQIEPQRKKALHAREKKVKNRLNKKLSELAQVEKQIKEASIQTEHIEESIKAEQIKPEGKNRAHVEEENAKRSLLKELKAKSSKLSQGINSLKFHLHLIASDMNSEQIEPKRKEALHARKKKLKNRLSKKLSELAQVKIEEASIHNEHIEETFKSEGKKRAAPAEEENTKKSRLAKSSKLSHGINCLNDHLHQNTSDMNAEQIEPQRKGTLHVKEEKPEKHLNWEPPELAKVKEQNNKASMQSNFIQEKPKKHLNWKPPELAEVKEQNNKASMQSNFIKDIPSSSKLVSATTKNKTTPSSSSRLLYADILNLSGKYFPIHRPWNILMADDRIREFVTAAKKDGWEVVGFIDACIESEETRKKWRSRREREMTEMRRNMPNGISTILGQLFHSHGVTVHYSVERDCDDTLAIFAHQDGAYILSHDRDFFRYEGANFLAKDDKQLPRVFQDYEMRSKTNSLVLIPHSNPFPKPRLEKIQLELDTSPKPLTHTAVTGSRLIQVLKDQKYIQGVSTPLARILGNGHSIVRPLRSAVYSRLRSFDSRIDLQVPIMEEIPEWDPKEGKVVWSEIFVDPSRPHELGEKMLDSRDPTAAIRHFFPELFCEREKANKLEGRRVKSQEWEKHRFCCHQLVHELFCEGLHNRTLVQALLDDPYISRKKKPEENENVFKIPVFATNRNYFY